MWALIIITMRLHTTNQLFSDTKKIDQNTGGFKTMI